MTLANQQELIGSLVEHGLSQKGAVIYLSLLERGPSTAQELAKASGVNRATVYLNCDALKQEGLVKVSGGVKQIFIAESPDVLERASEARVQKWQNTHTSIKSIVSDLKGVQKESVHKPTVTIREGKKGIINTMEDSLSVKDNTIRIMSSAEGLAKIVPDYMMTYVQRRIARQIKMLGIHPADSACAELAKHMPSIDEPLLIPADKFQFPAEVAIYGDKVGYITPECDGIGVTIDSKPIATIMRNLFDLAFEEARRLDKVEQKKIQKMVLEAKRIGAQASKKKNTSKSL